MNKKVLIIFAIAIRLSLFSYAEIKAPQSKFQSDTVTYTQPATNLIRHAAFSNAYNQDGSYSPETFRTPGYPLFLGIFHDLMKISYSGVVLIQIFLTILAAYFTYKAALIINPKLAFLSSLIVLYDPPVTIFSLMLLSESLFLFSISIFMYMFVLYLKTQKTKFLLFSALILVLATYVRPISYYLGLASGIFLIYLSIRTKIKKIIIHILVFLTIAYSLLGLWQFRNYKLSGKNVFSSWEKEFGPWYRKDTRDDTELTKSLPPLPYYLNAVSRCIVSLMTDPGTLKYFNSVNLKFIGKVFAYPWMVFWLIGFIIGTAKINNNFYLQFLAWCALYFIAASVGGVLFGIGSRFRVPMVPCLAILSSYGWLRVVSIVNRNNK